MFPEEETTTTATFPRRVSLSPSIFPSSPLTPWQQALRRKPARENGSSLKRGKTITSDLNHVCSLLGTSILEGRDLASGGVSDPFLLPPLLPPSRRLGAIRGALGLVLTSVSHYYRGSPQDSLRIPLELEHALLGGSSRS